MQLDTRQLNNLCTGVKLAAELESGSPDLRKFITVQGYSYSTDGKVIKPKKNLNSNTLDSIYFELKCYELSNDYFVNDWDVTEDDLASEVYQDDIKGIGALETELSNYIQDFSFLKPEWYCDNLLYFLFLFTRSG